MEYLEFFIFFSIFLSNICLLKVIRSIFSTNQKIMTRFNTFSMGRKMNKKNIFNGIETQLKAFDKFKRKRKRCCNILARIIISMMMECFRIWIKRWKFIFHLWILSNFSFYQLTLIINPELSHYATSMYQRH